MSIQTIGDRTRRARKVHACDLCGSRIKVGDLHRVATNIYDGRVYDWRECLPCCRDGVCNHAHAWTGFDSEGVSSEQAMEWAKETAWGWPKHWRGGPVSATERKAARDWLARAAGGESE